MTLVEAMDEFPQIKLKIAGTGPLLEELKSRKLKNVEFLGFRSGEDLFEEVRCASFIIVPSEWEENNPMTIIESYSYGKPVIGSRIGGIPEIIEDEKTGLIFEAFDKKDLVRVIRKALCMTDLQYKEMILNARNFAEKHFSPNNYYHSLMDIYQSVIHR